jgi:hypothetical protein
VWRQVINYGQQRADIGSLAYAESLLQYALALAQRLTLGGYRWLESQ